MTFSVKKWQVNTIELNKKIELNLLIKPYFVRRLKLELDISILHFFVFFPKN